MKRLSFFICLLPIVLFSQRNKETFLIADSTYINTVIFEPVEKRLTRVTIKDNFLLLNEITSLAIPYNETLETYIGKYSNYGWLPKTYGLYEFYKPLFISKLREYGLPEDLAYLPIIESNLNARAGSWVGAKGLWQFMAATGKEYDLFATNSINLFYDPYLATDSACKYLKSLYKLLGDWNLVLSAYNWGQGRILNLIKKHGTRNYWALRPHMPKETQAYAPSFHAVKYLYNFYDLYYKNRVIFKYNWTDVSVLTVNSKTSLMKFATDFNVEYGTINFLNPHILGYDAPKQSFVYVIDRRKK
ncbi:lytic transglycosylase domain-containing protein [Chryseobacterium sp. 18068]|uniref:lytic transglycosylase domain-containing protein n=1 Tax=Chryseobacterium sp. 18068 TaxID=2681414 RepID=UPI001356A414|nr:lytic transglycosylase domain-containing protein [Chryseobacterium sp. 18068]